MNRVRSARPLAIVLGGNVLIGVVLASAAPPPPKGAAELTYGAASASASASDRADAVPVGSHRSWVPEPVADFPRQRSPKPSRADWADAPDARDARITEPSCTLKRLREWYRLECNELGLQLVAGTRDELDVGGRKTSAEQDRYDHVWAVFPARPGDRRFFELFTWSKWAPGHEDALASFSWLDGEPAPSITIEGLRGGI